MNIIINLLTLYRIPNLKKINEIIIRSYYILINMEINKIKKLFLFRIGIYINSMEKDKIIDCTYKYKIMEIGINNILTNPELSLNDEIIIPFISLFKNIKPYEKTTKPEIFKVFEIIKKDLNISIINFIKKFQDDKPYIINAFKKITHIKQLKNIWVLSHFVLYNQLILEEQGNKQTIYYPIIEEIFAKMIIELGGWSDVTKIIASKNNTVKLIETIFSYPKIYNLEEANYIVKIIKNFKNIDDGIKEIKKLQDNILISIEEIKEIEGIKILNEKSMPALNESLEILNKNFENFVVDLENEILNQRNEI